jgi:DNA-binding NtrC family response regulator
MARVLVIDDDTMLRETLRAVLELEDHTVSASPDLAGGLRLLETEPFDLVVTDLFTHRSALEAFAPLHALIQAAPDTPIVVTTAFADVGTLTPTDYGLADIILKPFELDDFLARLQQVMEASRKQLHASCYTAEAAWEQLRSAHEHIADASALLRRFDPPDDETIP